MMKIWFGVGKLADKGNRKKMILSHFFLPLNLFAKEALQIHKDIHSIDVFRKLSIYRENNEV